MEAARTISWRPERLVSLDLFRGLIMFLLTAEAAGVYDALGGFTAGTLFEPMIRQFHHHPWNGLRFWDLIQPYFMFIVGVAMVFSLEKRWARGATWADTFRHIAYRCFVLFWLGVILHCGYSGALVWELWNVLTQLSVTIMVAFLLFRLPWKVQLAVSFALLGLTEVLYRAWPVAGFDHPFVQGENFGAWLDLVLMDQINGGGWVAVNALPTSAHTIWGVLAGKLLTSDRSMTEKLKPLVAAGLIGLALGYGLDWSGVTPIIKRICTSSFVIVSGGWCLLTLALFVWLIDGRGVRRGVLFFVIVGMSPIFIYLFSEIVLKLWFNDYVAIFTGGVLGWIGAPPPAVEVATAFTALAVAWGLCYWLYRRRIIVKI